MNRPGIIDSRRGDSAAYAAAKTILVGKPIPVDATAREPCCKHAAGPVVIRRYAEPRGRHHMVKGLILSPLQSQPGGPAFLCGRLAGPQDHAVGVWVARGYALRI